jgi:hypothetical protein
MKQLLVLCALALMTTWVQASDANILDVKTFRFDFSCDFGAPGKTTILEPQTSTFHADARVFADADVNNVTMNALQVSHNLNNYVSISRNGNLVFADTAVLFANEHDVVITGSNGVSPSITVKRDNRPLTDRTPSMCYDSSLRFGDRHEFSGQCCVKTKQIGPTEFDETLQ